MEACGASIHLGAHQQFVLGAEDSRCDCSPILEAFHFSADGVEKDHYVNRILREPGLAHSVLETPLLESIQLPEPESNKENDHQEHHQM